MALCLRMVEYVLLSVHSGLCMGVRVDVCLWGVCVFVVGREGPMFQNIGHFLLQTFFSPQTPRWSSLVRPEHQGRWRSPLLGGPPSFLTSFYPYLSGPSVSLTPLACLLSSSPFLSLFLFISSSVSSPPLFSFKRGGGFSV